MEESDHCATCGAPLDRGAPDGLCAACLFGAGMMPDEADDPGEVDVIAENPGDRVGRYLLGEKIGQGAFGVVFRAEQTTPVRRVVAVKIIKPGMDSREVVTRFEAERQALALMNHPHIAKVYDAGTTERGRPYFVMELVEGSPLTGFCDGRSLGMRERLELFVQLCEAVQHAHQKGIIHRDLKPGNILVSVDEEGVVTPKVIDFGVAKAVNMELTDKTFFTIFGQMMGTPQYMSPEQTDLNAVDVDTRSDIYSLGVLLYELVTGRPPIENERLTSAGFDEMRRIIREETPPRPSTRVGGLAGEELQEAAAARELDPGRFRRHLQGDLDWVVMKALEKDRSRRYETAQGLANDVRNFLANQPVSAGPPGAAYRVRKFVARNRAAVLASALIMLSLVGGIIVAKKKADEAEYEHLVSLVRGVWNWREAQPGSRGDALGALAAVGFFNLKSIGLSEREAGELRDEARDALFACMLWVDLEEEVILRDLGSPWVPAAVDRSGKKVVLALGGGRIEVREISSGEVLHEWTSEGGSWRGFLRISPEGTLVATARGGEGGWTVEVRNLSTGEVFSPSVTGTGRAFDFHPGDGGMVIGTESGTILRLKPDGGTVAEIDLEGRSPRALRVRPDGAAVAVALAGGGVEVLGTSRISWPQLASRDVLSLAWSPDGASLVAGAADGSVLVLDVEGTGAETMEQRHGGPVEQVAWSADGRLMASSSRDEVWLWDGRQRVRLTEFSAWARTLDFTEDGLALGPVTPDDDTHALALLQVKRSDACSAVAGHPGCQIVASAWMFKGGVLVTGAEDGVRFWNKEGRALAHRPDLLVQPGGILATGAGPREDGADVLLLAGADGIYRLQLSIDGGGLAFLSHRRFSDVVGGEQLALSPDGGFLAVAHDREVVLVDGTTGVHLYDLPSPAPTRFVSISPDPQDPWLAAGTRGGTGVRLWSLRGLREPEAVLPEPVDLPVTGSAMVSFFPVTERRDRAVPPTLLTGDDQAYRLWQQDVSGAWVNRESSPNRMANPEGRVATMAFSPRGTVVVGSIDRRCLRIMNPADLSTLSEPIFEKQWPLAVDLQGRRMANEATDGRLFIWDLAQARAELAKCNLDWEFFSPFRDDEAPLVRP